MMKWLLIVTMTITFTATGAPAWSAPRGGKNTEIAAKGPRKHLSTIVFAGVAGAILGLSTLSFYGRPQDRLNNIAMGAAFGIILGATFTTFKAATEPRHFYNRTDKDNELWAALDNPRNQAHKVASFSVFELTR